MTVEQYDPPRPVNGSQIQQWHDTSDTDATLARVESWARAAVAVRGMAENLCSTSFVPAQFRGKADEATAAMLAGIELGFSPMGALRAFDVIQGVAAPKAITHRAVVQAQGHEIWVVWDECSDTQAVVRGRRKGSEQVQESKWTIERARGLQLTSKDNWKKQPGAMLIARATSECARFVASDALLGMPYSVEEIRDDAGLTEASPDDRRALPRQARRGSTSMTAADLTGDAPVEAVPAETVDVQTITRDQGKRIGDLFHEAEVDDRAVRARIVNQLTDRPISGPGDLTFDEAESLISTLDEMGPADINALAGATYGQDEQDGGEEK